MLDTPSFKQRLYGIAGGFQFISRPGQLLHNSCFESFKKRWTSGEPFPIRIQVGSYPIMGYEEWAAGCLVQQLESLGFAASAIIPPAINITVVEVHGYNESR